MSMTPLDRLERASDRRGEVQEEYRDALQECVDAGYSNVAMAHRLCVTEAAIRMYRKRNNITRKPTV